MNEAEIKKLIELLEESGIAELEIKEGEESVRISRQSSSVQCSRTHILNGRISNSRRTPSGSGRVGSWGTLSGDRREDA